MELRIIDSLEKVFPHNPLPNELREISVLKNERFSFQIAFIGETAPARLRIDTDCDGEISINLLHRVPADFGTREGYDADTIISDDGLYPDLLEPIENDSAFLTESKSNCVFWITVVPNEAFTPGIYTFKVTVEQNGIKYIRELYVKISASALPEQQLIYTDWMHYDCIAQYYNLDVFSEDYWNMLEKYIKTAALYGVNMLLTPIFTPATDTAVGSERLTCQLTDITLENGKYIFGFEKLDRFVHLAEKCGIRYFEMSHLFTQWGAEYCPKIMVTENGKTENRFGWNVPSSSDEYRNFLTAFLPSLCNELKRLGIAERCFFHVSDEPNLEHIDAYTAGAELVKSLTPGFRIIDALSNTDFYISGAVKCPVCATNHAKPFMELGVRPLWLYYCCEQYKGLANRFIQMPSVRNRFLGLQLYVTDAQGFLHWGYNFYNSALSVKAIDPYTVTNAGGFFPSGDSFIVYPGTDAPIPSLRADVFYAGLQDLRLLRLAEAIIGRMALLHIIDEIFGEKVTLYGPYDAEKLYLLRNRCIDIVSKNL